MNILCTETLGGVKKAFACHSLIHLQFYTIRGQQIGSHEQNDVVNYFCCLVPNVYLFEW